MSVKSSRDLAGLRAVGRIVGVILPGDLVKLDLTAEKDGFSADAARSIAVPPASDEAQRLVQCAQYAFQEALRVARAGTRVTTGRRCSQRP